TLPVLRRQAMETASIAEAAYREGGADLLRLLDAQRVRIEAQQTYVEARVNYELAIVDLEQALGIPQAGGQP
ncbi:MAG: TolC family protein, partial [Bryobacterales bacterium]|nr:TolC family protein [Bryobacterales bacterium]